MSEPLSLAVILPALNEEAYLQATLLSLQCQTMPAERLLVVDGGSRDRTEHQARSMGVDVLVVSGRGRGGQVAAGVLAVSEEIVLVAHSDMVFPKHALESIRHRLVSEPACPGGCLGHRFTSTRWIFRLIEWLDQRRARGGISYGDQAQFFRRQWLSQVDGFPDLPMMEDVELSRRLQLLGRPAYLDLSVLVSPRRFEKLGILRTAWANWTFRRAYRRQGLEACKTIYRDYYG